MTLICLQYGQCGNQVGSDLFNVISEDIGPGCRTPSDYVQELSEKWFDIDSRGARKARAILIDTEDKAISALKFSSKSNWSFNRKCVATSKVGGSGNNWALGYYENGLDLVDKILDLADSLAEKCDEGLDGFLSILGLGGGTGSGLSCFVGQAIADHFPKTTRNSVSILPFSEGDVCTQPYNTALSITKLHESQDSVILISNDYLYKKCTQILKIKSVKIGDMNRILAEQLACSLSVGKLSQLIEHLTSHPAYRLLSLRSTPHVPPSHAIFETTPSWPSLVGQLKMSLVKSELDYDLRHFSRSATSSKQRSYNYYKCVANLLTCRGPNFSEAQIPTQDHPLNDSTIYPHWFPHTPQFLFSGNNKKFAMKDRFASLMTNCGISHKLLEPVLASALTLFNHEAYLHHYTRYGLTNEDFLYSFGKFEHILKDYNTLV